MVKNVRVTYLLAKISIFLTSYKTVIIILRNSDKTELHSLPNVI